MRSVLAKQLPLVIADGLVGSLAFRGRRREVGDITPTIQYFDLLQAVYFHPVHVSCSSQAHASMESSPPPPRALS